MKKIISSFVFIIVFATYVTFRPHTNTSPTGTSTTMSAAPIPTIPTNSTTTIPLVPTNKNSSRLTANNPKGKLSPTMPKANAHAHTTHARRGPYVDGVYIGSLADAYYESVQVRVVIRNGTLYRVSFLPFQVYSDTSREITNYAMPRLRTEALTVHSAQVDTISGATEISNAFRVSLTSALKKAT